MCESGRLAIRATRLNAEKIWLHKPSRDHSLEPEAAVSQGPERKPLPIHVARCAHPVLAERGTALPHIERAPDDALPVRPCSGDRVQHEAHRLVAVHRLRPRHGVALGLPQPPKDSPDRGRACRSSRTRACRASAGRSPRAAARFRAPPRRRRRPRPDRPSRASARCQGCPRPAGSTPRMPPALDRPAGPAPRARPPARGRRSPRRRRGPAGGRPAPGSARATPPPGAGRSGPGAGSCARPSASSARGRLAGGPARFGSGSSGRRSGRPAGCRRRS
jgi:hypothetical protein